MIVYKGKIDDSTVSTPADCTVRTPGKPKTPTKPKKNRSSMIMHLFKVHDSNMTPIEKFNHAVTVRNRSLGPKKALQLSPYLDVEVSDDNRCFLALTPDEVNIHRVLQQSTCRHGVRRKVVKRALTAIGGVSGMCGILNGGEQLKEIKAGLEFAKSYEEIRHAEQQRKKTVADEKKKKKVEKERKRAEQLAKTRAKMKQAYELCLDKLSVQTVYQSHVPKLNIAQLKVKYIIVVYFRVSWMTHRVYVFTGGGVCAVQRQEAVRSCC